MSPGRHDKIDVGRIDKGGFEDEDTAENIGCSLCFSVVPSGGSAGVPIYICAVLLTIASVILVVLGVALFFTPTPIGGIVFLFLAFLLSPYGLQAAAGFLLWALDGGKSALYRFLAS